MIIFGFLSLTDVTKFRFLSKRANSIYFFVGKKKGLNFILDSVKIFNSDEYINKIKENFIKSFYYQIKPELSFSDSLFLRYCLENFIRMMTISNVLMHLFYCPRAFFSKSDCLFCARLYLRSDIDFNINLSVLDKANFISNMKYEFVFFWDNSNQKDIINSDFRRCLKTVVIQNSYDLFIYYFEIEGRYFFNFFKSFLTVVELDSNQKSLLMNLSRQSFDNFLSYSIEYLNFESLKELFESVEPNYFQHIKVINKKYKDYLKRKYEN